MALNKEVFKTRALSAVVFVIIMLAGLLWNHWSFLVLFSIIHFGCWLEYLRLLEKIYGYHFQRFEKLGLMMMGFSIMLMVCGPVFQINGYSLAGNAVIPVRVAGMALLAYAWIRLRQAISLKATLAAMAGLLYISLSWACMLLLRQHNMDTLLGDFGWLYPMLLIASIWINDTMAYIVGSLIGKTPLSAISPKKTWEGTIGGALLAVVVVTVIAVIWLKADWKMIAAIAATAAVVGTLGDLLESWLKRKAGVKDSGQMMPGHGGFLDRFDSLLLATPFVYLLVLLLNA